MRDPESLEYLKYRWLSSVAEHLSPPARRFWEDLRDRFGELDNADRLWGPITVTWSKDITPALGEDLSQWSVRDIVRYCILFVGPEESFDGPSKKGLADALSAQVRDRPGEFSREAVEFEALGDVRSNPNPRYVQAAFRGFRSWLDQAEESTSATQEYIDTLAAMAGTSVTDLITWLMDQPEFETDVRQPNWESARRAAAGFLLGLLNKVMTLPAEAVALILGAAEQRILGALRALQKAADPAMVDTTAPLFRSLNSTRGIALSAAMAFQAAWMRSSPKTESNASELHPSIGQLFEEILNYEPHPAVRCVLGWKFPYLHHIAPNWSISKMAAIFPVLEQDVAIWRASWDAYVGFNQLYEPIWHILMDQYDLAVSRMGMSESQRFGPGDPNERLGSHVFLAWFARYENAETILERLLARSTDEQKGMLSRYGARVLHANLSVKGLGAGSEEWLSLESYLRGRLEERGLFGVAECGPKEANGFVDWFEEMPASLPDVIDVVEALSARFSNDGQSDWAARRLVDYLCSQSESFPIEAVKALGTLSSHIWPQWLSGDQIERVSATMRLASQQSSEGAGLVRELVEFLSKRHHFEYRDVLERRPDQG